MLPDPGLLRIVNPVLWRGSKHSLSRNYACSCWVGHEYPEAAMLWGNFKHIMRHCVSPLSTVSSSSVFTYVDERTVRYLHLPVIWVGPQTFKTSQPSPQSQRNTAKSFMFYLPKLLTLKIKQLGIFMPWGFEIVCYTIRDNKTYSQIHNQEEASGKV